MKLIGLNGRMRSGKDTAVEFIRSEANAFFAASERRTPVVQRTGFADKLKLSAALALGFRPDSVEEAVDICNSIKEYGRVRTYHEPGPTLMDISGRLFLQLYGTESHRDVFGDNFWVDALLPLRISKVTERVRPVDDLFPDVDVLVVTDCRFENEAQRILDLGGEVWRIDAEQRLGPLPEGSHPSEHGLPDSLVTRTVRNNGSLEDFQRAVSFATVEALSC